jgi:hypothetical protein
MKTFVEYLTESKRTYGFKIKVAGDLKEDFEERLKSALERFSISKMGKGKRTPIQEVPLDFPEAKYSHVTIFDVEINYPTTTQVLSDYIARMCDYNENMIRVRAEGEPSEQYQEEAVDKESDSDKPALLNTDIGDDDKQSPADLMSLIKELEKVKHQGEVYKGVNDQILAKDVPVEKPTAAPNNANTVSPIGSTARKGK